MSLRLQLVALFTAVLAATLLVASALGLRIGQRSVEDEIRKRTAELASATTLALKHAGNDDDQLSEELAATVGFSTDTNCDPMTQLCDPFAPAKDAAGTTHGPSARLLALQLTTQDTAKDVESFSNKLHLDELQGSLQAFTALQVDVQ